MALVMMGGLVGCGTKLDQRARHYDMTLGLLGPVGTMVALGAAGAVTAVEAVTPDSTPQTINGGEVGGGDTSPGEI